MFDVNQVTALCKPQFPTNRSPIKNSTDSTLHSKLEQNFLFRYKVEQQTQSFRQRQPITNYRVIHMGRRYFIFGFFIYRFRFDSCDNVLSVVLVNVCKRSFVVDFWYVLDSETIYKVLLWFACIYRAVRFGTQQQKTIHLKKMKTNHMIAEWYRYIYIFVLK